MIKKTLVLLSLLFSSVVSSAQLPVFQSKEILADQVKSGYYILLPTEDVASVSDAWQRFLQKEGKLQKNDVTLFQVNQPTSLLFRETDVQSITSKITGGKGFTKVFWAFESLRSRNPSVFRITEVNEWIQPFVFDVLSLLGNTMLGAELEQLKTDQKARDREVARLQSSIERNLKQQNKLDASIRRTPEELSKIISEKEELTQNLIQQQVTDEELIKQSAKKEKSIKRIQSQTKKQEKQLTNKEKTLRKLRTDFLQKEKERKQHLEVLESKPNRP